MEIEDGGARYGVAILETTPEFIKLYMLSDIGSNIAEILSNTEKAFLSYIRCTHYT